RAARLDNRGGTFSSAGALALTRPAPRGPPGGRRGARGPRQCRHVRVLRTTGHARACRESSHDRPPR
ncbi:hypothetical protein I5I52_28995, partial [Pseudomonas aeruginosa]|nr:hypothetical protein [Pseudomonas aeruginosa]